MAKKLPKYLYVKARGQLVDILPCYQTGNPIYISALDSAKGFSFGK